MTQARRPRGRPPLSSREKVEAVAIELFLEHGYSGTSLATIIEACGVSKTTFFRYFASKSEIIWYAFDTHTRHLRRLLAEADSSEPAMTVVRTCVVDALRASIDERGIWMKRFIILDGSPELRPEGSTQWTSWADAVSEYVAGRLGVSERGLVPASIGGAVQAAYLATLRGWQTSSKPVSELLLELEADLAPLCDVLQGWLDRQGPRR
ncbi:acyl-CoA-like ligand-binding transcription factor [Streptomyces acidicola]|uniref:TetR family transcriptional regulator n=1 Tax=Streptomyces acidicola TaxID=2596892 RepID=A0A5N8WLM6_9ACTN|nr:TetR family transcriptional regulator [Streptomyces acidicola]MPY48147.1 TetR family transcriptional regulator [Streptomyces acidicola]